MKARSLTHGIALLAGFAGAAAWRAAWPAGGEGAGPSATPLTVRTQDRGSPAGSGRDPAVAEMLADRLSQVTREVEAIDRLAARRALRPQEIATCRETVARRQALAQQYRTTADLNEPLGAALQAGDLDHAAAVFLEWSRRDPAAAFDALACRSAAWETLLTDPAFAAAARPADLAALYARCASLPEKFTLAVVDGHSTWLGMQGDRAAWRREAPQQPIGLWLQFTDGFLTEWLPDGPEQQKTFLLDDVQPYIGWNEGGEVKIRKPLPRVLRHEMDDPFFKAGSLTYMLLTRAVSPPEQPAEGLTLDDDPTTPEEIARDRLSAWNYDRGTEDGKTPDFAALYAQGRITPDQIRAGLLEQIPDAQTVPAELDQLVMSLILPVDAKGAVTWAQSQGLSAEMQRDALPRAMVYMEGFTAMQAAGIMDGMAGIPGWPPEDSSAVQSFVNGTFPPEYGTDPFDFWRKVNPEAAAPVMERLPQAWKQPPPQEEEPEDGGE